MNKKRIYRKEVTDAIDKGKGVQVRLSRKQLQDFEDAHAEGLHDEIPREFCPICDDQKGRT